MAPMAHVPINHPLRPVYRALTGLAGLYLLLFGLAGSVAARGLAAFERHDLPTVLGMPANPAFALLSIGAGAVILGGALIGRNLDFYINLVGGTAVLVVALAMLTVMRTDANILGFSMTSCIVWFIVGMVMLAGGLYGKVGSPAAAKAEEAFRHAAR